MLACFLFSGCGICVYDDDQWSDKKAYKETLVKLAGLFKNNFEGFVAHKIGKDDKLTDEILGAGPVL